MTLSRCAGNKFEFGGVFYTKSCFHSVLWTNFPKKKLKMGEDQWASGYMEGGYEVAVVKKTIDLDRNNLLDVVFASHQILSSTQFFYVGIKEFFCDRDG